MQLSDSLVTASVVAGTGLVAGFALYWIGSNRNAEKAIATKPGDLTAFIVYTSKAEVVRMLLFYAQVSRLKVESTDEAIGRIILGQNMNLITKHNGYWLPIYLTDNGNGTTTVEIGIKSKTYQIPFMLNLIRDKVVDNFKGAIVNQGYRTS